LLDRAWDDQSGLTLREQLRKSEDDANAPMLAGSLSSSSGLGRNVTFAGSQFGNVSTADIARAYRRLIDLYDINLAALGLVGGNTPDDLQVKNAMMDNLREVAGYTSNFMYLAK
jgi:hypothetical protein